MFLGHDDNARIVPGKDHRQIETAVAAGCIENHGRPAAGDCAEFLPDVFCRCINRAISADEQRAARALIDNVGYDHIARAVVAACCGKKQPDRARTDDQHARACERHGQSSRMQADCQWLGDCRRPEGDLVGKMDRMIGWNARIFGVAAPGAGKPDETGLAAICDAFGATGFASAAGEDRKTSDAIADAPALLCAGSDFDDLACELVTEDGAGRQRLTENTVRVFGRVQIAAANAARADAHDNFIRPGMRIGHTIDDKRTAGGFEDGGEHDVEALHSSVARWR